MKLEDQVTSLEISKRLFELGVKQNSLFYWTSYNNFIFDTVSSLSVRPGDEIDEFYIDKNIISQKGCSECRYEIKVAASYSAFTVAELGEMLLWCVYWNPLVIKKLKDSDDSIIFDVRYENHVRLFSKNISLANAMGELVILLTKEPTLWNWKEKWLEVKDEKYESGCDPITARENI